MSNSDHFLEEVAEEVRRDRLFAFFRRYGWIAVLLVVGIVAGAAWNEWQKQRARAAAEAFGDAILSALAVEDPQARVAALEAVAADSPERRALIALLAAGQLAREDAHEEAARRLDRLGAETALPPRYRDLAAIKGAAFLDDFRDATTRAAALEPLEEPGRPYRPLALEGRGLALIEAGEREAGIGLLRAAMEDSTASDALRQRIGQILLALGIDSAREG